MSNIEEETNRISQEIEDTLLNQQKEANKYKAAIAEAQKLIDSFEVNKLTKISELEKQKLLLENNFKDIQLQLNSEKNNISRETGTKIYDLDNKIEDLKEKISNIKAKLTENKNKYSLLLAEFELKAKDYGDKLTRYTQHQEFLTVHREKLAEFKKKAALEKEFQELTGRDGFLGCIFDEVLAEITHETNELLKGLPNVTNVTISLRSDKVLQKGEVRKKITPIVFKSGIEVPIKAGISGGMYTVVELAVDLAVAKVISRRTGVVPGWLILDEALDGLGPIEKEACLNLLREYASDRLVLLIDHDPATKGLVDGGFMVESVNEESTISPYLT